MITKVSAMNSMEIETECRRMADSYLDYEMTGSNLGMCEHLDKEHFYRFTRSYFESAMTPPTAICTLIAFQIRFRVAAAAGEIPLRFRFVAFKRLPKTCAFSFPMLHKAFYIHRGISQKQPNLMGKRIFCFGSGLSFSKPNEC